jgi:hypothetical protein
MDNGLCRVRARDRSVLERASPPAAIGEDAPLPDVCGGALELALACGRKDVQHEQVPSVVSELRRERDCGGEKVTVKHTDTERLDWLGVNTRINHIVAAIEAEKGD